MRSAATVLVVLGLCAAPVVSSCAEERSADEDPILRCSSPAGFAADLRAAWSYAKRPGIPFEKKHLLAGLARIDNWIKARSNRPSLEDIEPFCDWRMATIAEFGRTGKLPTPSKSEPGGSR